MCYKKTNQNYPTDRLGSLTRHHRRPKSKGGANEGENISFVPEKLHNAWHLLFANYSVSKVAEIMNEHWVDPDYVMIPIPKDFLDVIYQTLSKTRR